MKQMETVKTEKLFYRFYGQTGSGKREKLVFLEFSREAQIVDTPTFLVAALGKPQ